jgi:nucleotide-binding universal stress UspA family protein
MPYRKILVPVIGTTSDKAALSAAFVLAKQFGAHVEVLFVRLDPVRAVPYGYVGGDVSGYSAQYAIEAAIRASDEAQKVASEAFRTTVGKFGLELKDKPGARPDATAHLKVVQGDFAIEIERASRLSDLVVFALMPNANEQETIREGFEAALLSGTHPVLFVPSEPAEGPGQRIAIAYDGSATAAHAVMGALPFLSRAKAVHSFEITPATGVSEPLDELHAYLALRGIDVIEHLVDPGPKSTAEALVNAVQAQRCDLLVMGGYGHSRIREFVLGGVTRHLLRHGAPCAVLMAH